MAARDRRAVLRNLLLAWAPFDHCEYRVVLRGDAALAYAWDAANPALSQAAGAELWPEPMLREPPASDGLRLLACLDGYELQWWSAGLPRMSRWLPELPDAGQCEAFRRSVGVNDVGEGRGEGLEPVAIDQCWRSASWAEMLSLEGLTNNWSRLERVAVGVSAVGLMVLSGAQARDAYDAYREHAVAERALEQARLAAGPVLAARDQALAHSREAESLARQMTGAQPLEVLMHIGQLLPAKGVVIKEFDLRGDKLNLGVELTPDVQRSAVVRELQSGGWFTGVAEQREVAGRNWVNFEMTLKGFLPPPPRSAGSAAAQERRT